MSDKTTRERIVEAADRLFYERGFEYTSFSDIAQAVQLSRGNFYFHFKSKDEILESVIGARLASTRRMLEQWEIEGKAPAERIRSFIHILVANRTDIERFGCPVGTLCIELAKLGHPSQRQANELFTLFRTWLRRQFTLLGCADADALALHLLARSQGVATLAGAFHEDKFISDEVAQMCEWLDARARSAAQVAHASAAPPAKESHRAVAPKRATRSARPAKQPRR